MLRQASHWCTGQWLSTMKNSLVCCWNLCSPAKQVSKFHLHNPLISFTCFTARIANFTHLWFLIMYVREFWIPALLLHEIKMNYASLIMLRLVIFKWDSYNNLKFLQTNHQTCIQIFIRLIVHIVWGFNCFLLIQLSLSAVWITVAVAHVKEEPRVIEDIPLSRISLKLPLINRNCWVQK